MNLYGASGHAKVIIDILKRSEIGISKIYDDNIEIEKMLEFPVSVYNGSENNDLFIISIGNNKIRKKISQKLDAEFGMAVHPNSIIDPTVIIKEGIVIMAGTVINSSVKIGKHCIINTSASVDHDCILEDYVHISPTATLCGGVRIGEGTQVGAGAVIIPGITVGKWSTIGAGAVIIKDIPDGVTVVGNPGRVLNLPDEGSKLKGEGEKERRSEEKR